MKLHSVFLILLFFSPSCFAKLGSNWIANAPAISQFTKEYPTRENVVNLGRKLIGVAHYNSGSEEERVAINIIVTTLLSIPGHAQYIADEVERFRKEVQHLPRMNQVGYDRERQWLIAETLRHLPSPETIQVLGHYLDDERDTPPELVFLPENSFLGCVALSEIGLRKSPVSARPGIHNWREELVKQKAWYAQVKAGTLTFSFVGQKVEYRFRADGTWETLAMANPPDDGPSRIKAEQSAPVRPPRRSIVDNDSSGRSERGSLWPWVIGIPVLLLAGAIWLRFRKSAGLNPH